MATRGLPYGDGLKADLYYPLDADSKPAPGKWPVVVWLHAYSYHTGYSRYAGPPLASLTKRGFAVAAFDQLGFGARVLDARAFYDQYPRWSLMGKMVADTRAVVNALSALDVIDQSRIYVVGYGLGAKIALLVAALEPRVKAVASVAGFDTLRLQTAKNGTEGLRHYSHLHGLMPRLGFFIGYEDRLPLDFDEVVAFAAPKPILVIAPTLDRYVAVADVTRTVEAAKQAYRREGRDDALRLETPLEFNRFTRPMQERVFDWLAAQ
jgi:dienelactone hydrolase